MSSKLKWVTNVWKTPTDERIGDAVISVKEQMEWRSQFIKGDPRATKLETVELLKAMGVIGLYSEVTE